MLALGMYILNSISRKNALNIIYSYGGNQHTINLLYFDLYFNTAWLRRTQL